MLLYIILYCLLILFYVVDADGMCAEKDEEDGDNKKSGDKNKKNKKKNKNKNNKDNGDENGRLCDMILAG